MSGLYANFEFSRVMSMPICGPSRASCCFTPTSNQGWICPKCGRVLAPHVNGCDCCNSLLRPAVPDVPRQPTTGDPIPPNPVITCGGGAL